VRTEPPTDPDLDRAQALLEDFARFWQAEAQGAERRRHLMSLFECIWQQDGVIVAVKPHTAFARFFQLASNGQQHPHKADPDIGVTKAGATGLEPATSAVTGQRSNQLSYAPRVLHAREMRREVRSPSMPSHAAG
jgi:hypothetical protein